VRKENAANKSVNERSGSSAWALVNPAISTRIFTTPVPSCCMKYLNRVTVTLQNSIIIIIIIIIFANNNNNNKVQSMTVLLKM